jgi:2-polyprenyl-3-methyl-5-hydroxy-6-metoxy-1,4-benzoquinol methylase
MKNCKCILCGEDGLKQSPLFNLLPRVTSDCKPFPSGGALYQCQACSFIQKFSDANLVSEISKIYGQYEIYKIAGGKEQLIFNGKKIAPRSKFLVDFLQNTAVKSDFGSMIDIGCGNGSMLKSFGLAFPEWRLNGTELREDGLGELQKISNFKRLYGGDIYQIEEKFDLITLIHSLEHMKSPRDFIKTLLTKLKKNGKILIQVPDYENSIFDVLIADHISHFTVKTLTRMMRSLGVSIDYISNEYIVKEITLLISTPILDAEEKALLTKDDIKILDFDSRVLYLIKMLDHARSYAEKKPDFGIFGTSISAMWLYGGINHKASFFADEDPSKQGANIDGKIIIDPRHLKDGTNIYLPLNKSVSKVLSNRYKNLNIEYYDFS